jgi:hypothetical protein
MSYSCLVLVFSSSDLCAGDEREEIEYEKTSRKYEDERINTNIVLASRTRLLLLGFPLLVFSRRGAETQRRL